MFYYIFIFCFLFCASCFSEETLQQYEKKLNQLRRSGMEIDPAFLKKFASSLIKKLKNDIPLCEQLEEKERREAMEAEDWRESLKKKKQSVSCEAYDGDDEEITQSDILSGEIGWMAEILIMIRNRFSEESDCWKTIQQIFDAEEEQFANACDEAVDFLER